MHTDEFYNSLDMQYKILIPVKNSKPLIYNEKHHDGITGQKQQHY